MLYRYNSAEKIILHEILIVLKNRGYKINHKTALKLMKELNRTYYYVDLKQLKHRDTGDRESN